MQMNVPMSEEAFIHRELGKMIAMLTSLKEDMEKSETASHSHREEIKQQLSDVDTKIHEMNRKVESVERLSAANANTITDDVLPTVKKVKVWEQRGIGFLAFAGIAGTSLGAAVMTYAEELASVWSAMWK